VGRYLVRIQAEEHFLRVFYTDKYIVPLPPQHRFPMEKYRLVRLALLQSQILQANELYEPTLATPAMIKLAHQASYVEAICSGQVDPKVMRRVGFPWSPALVVRSLAAVGGALDAAHEALRCGVSGNLAGGTHHALPEAGEGFCVFNDIAVVILQLLAERRIRRAAIVDLDVHQGNGNAAILASRPEVFVFSMHGAKNYPFHKVPSDLDIDLPDGTTDAVYLEHLANALPQVLAFQPDIIFYQAGVDPLKEDSLGRLALSMAGLAARDQMVLATCYANNIPVSLALGGGYAKPLDLTVQAHAQTYQILKSIYGN
jgi:acetoin utilization deacetylase AcuC-like enzyme